MGRFGRKVEQVKARAVFLDRDGVLTGSETRDGRPYAPRRLGEFRILPGVLECLEALQRAGWKLIVVTNQPDVATGKLDASVLEEMHSLLKASLPLDAIKVCRHADADLCACRKPLPGMLLEGAVDFHVDLGSSFMVGDRWRDVSAGKAAGCRTVFIDYGYAEALPDEPDQVVGSFEEACRVILASGPAECVLR